MDSIIFSNPNANWLYLSVKPSPELEKLRYELAQRLIRSNSLIKTCQPFDHDSRYKFHSAIKKCDPRDKDKFTKLIEFAETKCTLEEFKKHKASVLERFINSVMRLFSSREEHDSDINVSGHPKSGHPWDGLKPAIKAITLAYSIAKDGGAHGELP